jgi:transposase-like protein
VRAAGRIVSVAVTISVAANTDGRREALGMDTGASEAETFWIDFLRGLKRRGLAGVKLVISERTRHQGRVTRYSAPPGSAAECSPCATPSSMPVRAAGASSRR